ncbi:MAG TPA: hypothetical protein P5511_00130 [Candidatus Goldiibacteriota bacterium]|nr:hypothetical protein [Candidatus Goldiibacteriota bacterium]
MKKLFALFFALCLCLPAFGADMFGHIPYKSAQWKSKTTVDGPDEKFTFEQSVFYSNKKMRTEGDFVNRATGEKEPQVTIIDSEYMYSYNPVKKQGMKYSLKSAGNPAAVESEQAKCRESAKKTGSEKVGGVVCDKYEYSCKIGNSNVKITEFRDKSGFVIKTVSKMDNITTTVETSGLKINASIPSSKFSPENGVKFMDMDKMTGNVMKMMKDTKAASPKNTVKKTQKQPEDEDEAEGSDDGSDGEAGQKIMKDMMKGMFGE